MLQVAKNICFKPALVNINRRYLSMGNVNPQELGKFSSLGRFDVSCCVCCNYSFFPFYEDINLAPIPLVSGGIVLQREERVHCMQ